MNPGQKKTKHSVEDLNKLYIDSEDQDKEIFAEMRSNILLTAGDHYTRRGSKFYTRIRESTGLSEEMRLRLTKNHTQRIVKSYSNNISSFVPGVRCSPNNQTELQDQKAAELHQAVWEFGKTRYGLDSLRDSWIDSYVEIGEVCCFIYWHPGIGDIVAYNQKTDSDGNPLFEEDGVTPAAGEPVYSGDFVFKEVYGFNLLRSKESLSMKDSPYLIFREIVTKDEAKKLISGLPDKEEKEKFLNAKTSDIYVVFDHVNGYRESKDSVVLRYYFFKPCLQYPRGYFYLGTEEGILHEMELPFGVWPIAWEAFDTFPTAPRGRSIIKTLRTYQVEINRTASAIAEHQVTIGSDKILIQNGTKISAGVSLPGIRSLTYSGMAPTILEGRTGSQYLDYMNSQITEMYQVAMVAEDSETKEVQLDPYSLLFRAANQKKRFTRYTRRFENFLKQVCSIYLELAKNYYPDNMVIPAIGRREAINLSEYRDSTPFGFQIRLEAQSEDVESKLGRQLVLNHVIQYAGAQLKPEQVGQIMRSMPYGNLEEAFSDLTIDYDSAKNAMLLLERGQMPQVGPYDDPIYMIKRITKRMRDSDFQFLNPQIQDNYRQYISMYQQLQVENEQKIQAAKNGYIPIGGTMIACDMYVTDPNNPQKTPRRVRIPYQALDWLLSRLNTQGQSLENLESLNQGALAEMAQMFSVQNQAQLPFDGQGLVGSTQELGQASPIGELDVNTTGSYAGYRG